MEKYVRGVEWLKEILYGIQFSADRLLVVANKMINDVARLVGHTWDPASPPCGEYESLVFFWSVLPRNDFIYFRFKRKGAHIAKTLLWHQLYSDHSSPNLSSMLTQLSFLTSLTGKLKESPSADQVMTAMNRVREVLTSPANLRVFMAANVTSLPTSDPLEPWNNFHPQRCSLIRITLSPSCQVCNPQ